VLLLHRWIANLVGFVVMVLLGEWFCVRREMQDIPMSEWPGTGTAVGQTAAVRQFLSLVGKQSCTRLTHAEALCSIGVALTI
jgi:hypothetical protein